MSWESMVRNGRRLRLFAGFVLVLNALAAVVAIVFNLPAQFDGVGTDAGSEFLSRGTAISAPLLPVAFLLIVLVLGARRDRWAWLGVAAAYLAAISMAIGGVGEMLAEPTADTPRAVLVPSGVTFSTIATVLAVLATVVITSRWSAEKSRVAKP